MYTEVIDQIIRISFIGQICPHIQYKEFDSDSLHYSEDDIKTEQQVKGYTNCKIKVVSGQTALQQTVL